MTQLGDGNFEAAAAGMMNRRSRDALDQEHESRSGSDNVDGLASGDDQDATDKPPRKKRYHRHTPQQIQELEAYDFMLIHFLQKLIFLVVDNCSRGFIWAFFAFFFQTKKVCSRSVLIPMKSKGWSSARDYVWRPGK